jgi:hypothetical protein
VSASRQGDLLVQLGKSDFARKTGLLQEYGASSGGIDRSLAEGVKYHQKTKLGYEQF